MPAEDHNTTYTEALRAADVSSDEAKREIATIHDEAQEGVAQMRQEADAKAKHEYEKKLVHNAEAARLAHEAIRSRAAIAYDLVCRRHRLEVERADKAYDLAVAEGSGLGAVIPVHRRQYAAQASALISQWVLTPLVQGGWLGRRSLRNKINQGNHGDDCCDLWFKCCTATKTGSPGEALGIRVASGRIAVYMGYLCLFVPPPLTVRALLTTVHTVLFINKRAARLAATMRE